MKRRGVITVTSSVLGGMAGLPVAAGATEDSAADSSDESGVVLPGASEQTVPAGQPVSHRYGWITIDRGPSWIRHLRDATTLEATVDGQPVAQPTQYWGDIHTTGDQTAAWWSYDARKTVGTHQFEVTVRFDEPVTSPLDGSTWSGEHTLSGEYTVVPSERE